MIKDEWKLRAEQAEAREKALLSSYDEERKVLADNKRLTAEVERWKQAWAENEEKYERTYARAAEVEAKK